jgi:hypothetical protein
MRLLLACLTPLTAVPAPAENDTITIAAVSQGREPVSLFLTSTGRSRASPKGDR